MHFLPVEWHDLLPSTNMYLEIKIANNEPVPTGIIVAARQQTAGIGRYNRSWFSGKNQNLAFSFLMQVNVQPIELPSLTMACAIAIANVLRAMNMDAVTKWPNDVLVNNKKICGILSKQIPKPDDDGYFVIVGCGININMTSSDAKNIDKPATSVFIETGKQYQLESLLLDFLNAIQSKVSLWEENGFAGIQQEWEQLHKPLGTYMMLNENEIKISGALTGFGEHGELILFDADGQQHTIIQGDVNYE